MSGRSADRPDVLALAFEVDYWDRLGWKDTFSKAAWTERQYAYARAMGHGDSVYTPQVVVNGRVEGDGLEPGALAGLISRGDRGAGGPSVGFSGGAVTVGAGRRAGRRRRRLARALYSRTCRGHDSARRERRPHIALQGRGARDGPLGQWRGEAATFPVPGGDPGAGGGGDRAGERGRADPRGGEEITNGLIAEIGGIRPRRINP